MEMLVRSETLFYSLISILLGLVAYFLRQLHSDFKRMEKDVTEVKSTINLIKAEFKGIIDVMNQKVEFQEKQMNHFKTIFFK